MHKQVLLMSRVVAIAALALSGSAFAAGQDGQTVFKDPVTGKFRNPTADEAKQLNDLRAADKAAAKAERKQSNVAAKGAPAGTAVRQANGIIQGTLDEESMTYSVMTRNAEGELVLQCVTGAESAKTAMSTPATTVSKEHKHEVQ